MSGRRARSRDRTAGCARDPSLPDVIAVVETRRVVVRVDARDAVHVGHLGAVLVNEGLQQQRNPGAFIAAPRGPLATATNARAAPSSPTS